jgi:transcription-repair coupling factor (superfamily II helicase)
VWLWAALFSLMALAGVAAIAGKFDIRQRQIEGRFLGRQQSAIERDRRAAGLPAVVVSPVALQALSDSADFLGRIQAAEKVELLPGAISRGFRVPDLQTTALSNVEFAGVPQQARVRERQVIPSRAIQSFFELGPGDLVVHAVHGIARFEGTELVTRGQGVEEHLRLCFQDEVKLLVPASKIHLVQKYVGSGGKAPLDKLGGKGFQRRKERGRSQGCNGGESDNSPIQGRSA